MTKIDIYAQRPTVTVALTAGVACYIGEDPVKVDFTKDHVVAGTWAVRATMSFGQVDFLLDGFAEGALARALPEESARELAEVEFTCWPPRRNAAHR
jgi:hypothetical protein